MKSETKLIVLIALALFTGCGWITLTLETSSLAERLTESLTKYKEYWEVENE